jgi:hypothetical protein
VPYTIEEQGLGEFISAALKADKLTRTVVRGRLQHAGDIVRENAAGRYRPRDTKSGAGLRVRARPVGAFVEQSVFVEQQLRKTTGLHPEWGSWQMRHALIPGLEAEQAAVLREIEGAVDELVALMERA